MKRLSKVVVASLILCLMLLSAFSTVTIVREEAKVVYADSFSESAIKKNPDLILDSEITVELKEKFSDSEEYWDIQKEKQRLYAREALGETVDFSEMEELMQRQRDACKEFYQKQKETFFEELDWDRNLFGGSEYSGFLSVSTEEIRRESDIAASLNRVAKSDSVDKVCVEAVHHYESDGWFGSWDGETLPTIHDTNWQYGPKGNGIKVGIYEAGNGIVNETLLESKYPNLTVNTYGSEAQVTDHAARVGAIIAALAPQCTIYSTYITDNYYERNPNLDWLIRNGVSIINCSFGSANGHKENKYYCTRENGFDTMAVDLGILFIFSAGNDGTTVNCPKEAANIITVGATNNDGVTKANYSNYGSQGNLVKPLLMANGAPHIPYMDDPFHTNCGTSFAAPMVTGALVKSAQNWPMGLGSGYLLGYTAVANATVRDDLVGGTYESGSNLITNYFGYGMLSVDTLEANAIPGKGAVLTFDNSTSEWSGNIYLYAGSPMQISIFWPSTGIVNDEPAFSDYNLYLYDEGRLVAYSDFTDRNLEMLAYTATETKSYQLKIVRVGNIAVGTQDSLAYYYSAVN